MKAKTMKITGIILTLVMLAAILGMLALYASAAAVSDLTVNIETGASVTLRDKDADGFYELSTEQDLIAFRVAVNSGRNTINVELMNNVDVVANYNWTPIGTISNPYSGYFDGKGYKVSGINISGTFGPQQEMGEGNIGFFGNIHKALRDKSRTDVYAVKKLFFRSRVATRLGKLAGGHHLCFLCKGLPTNMHSSSCRR